MAKQAKKTNGRASTSKTTKATKATKVAKVAKVAKPVKAAKRGTREAWSKQDLAELKKHSKSKTPVAQIAKDMGRSEGALRQKAYALELALGHRR
jgi:hypothetical protein